jgi:pyruvate dehydrogenase E2 component (dihydrolipoamide acetyltransferase)
VNDFIIKASSLALRAHPDANASWSDEGLVRHGSVDVSVAVAIEGGLITPILTNSDEKSIVSLSTEMKELAGLARAGKLAPEQYQGGTFSVSNLGMYGIKHFDAIINPPQSCILACGVAEERPVVRDGGLDVASVMTMTMSVDHRVVDGALGAELIGKIKFYLENPVTMFA